MLIGMASELQISDPSLFEYFSRSVFNIVCIPPREPIADFGISLISRGFNFGLELQAVLVAIVLKFDSEFGISLYKPPDSGPTDSDSGHVETSHSSENLSQNYFCSSKLLSVLAPTAGKALKCLQAHLNGFGINAVARFHLEVHIFVSILWEQILMSGFTQHLDSQKVG